jgi:hypothetical protein
MYLTIYSSSIIAFRVEIKPPELEEGEPEQESVADDTSFEP